MTQNYSKNFVFFAFFRACGIKNVKTGEVHFDGKARSSAISAITNTDDGIEGVKSLFSFYLTIALGLNCPNFSNS